MTAEHRHSTPSLQFHWSSFACKDCTPELYAAFTADVPATAFKDAHDRRCPICLEYAKYEYGKFRRHKQDDTDCRASGLSQEVAKHLLDCLLRGVSARLFLREARAAGRVPATVIVEVPESIPARLVSIRLDAGMSQPELAQALSVNVDTVRDWEAGRKSPRLDAAIRWAELFGRRFTLDDGDGFKMQVRSATTIAYFLAQRRGETSVGSLAKAIGVKGQTLSRWESGQNASSIRLVDMLDWSMQLGLELKMVGKDHDESQG